jgi:hypothetical protein
VSARRLITSYRTTEITVPDGLFVGAASFLRLVSEPTPPVGPALIVARTHTNPLFEHPSIERANSAPAPLGAAHSSAGASSAEIRSCTGSRSPFAAAARIREASLFLIAAVRFATGKMVKTSSSVVCSN